MEKKKAGTILWHDLSVPDAGAVSDFYRQVIGWEKSPLSMGEYDDYVMQVKGDDESESEGAGGHILTTTGICHAKGQNSYIPPQWMIYVAVDDLDKSLEQCTLHGGKIIGEKRSQGKEAVYCLIQDPAGAHMMLYQQI